MSYPKLKQIACGVSILILISPTLIKNIAEFFKVPLNKSTKLTWTLRSIINIHYDLKYSLFPQTVTKENVGVVSQLIIHPIKSVRGISLESCEVDEFGFKYDRMYMLSKWNSEKKKYEAITQRQTPRLCLVKIAIQDNQFLVRYPKKGTIDQYNDDFQFRLPMTVTDSFLNDLQNSKKEQGKYEDNEPVELWDVDFKTIVFDNLLPLSFLEELDLPPTTKLLYTITGKELITNAPSKQILSDTRFTKFQDYFPSLIMTEEELDDINDRLEKDFNAKYNEDTYNEQLAVSQTNFRPNLIIKGTSRPYDSDDWSQIEIIKKTDPSESHKWYITSKCPRCSIPNINQSTGIFYNKPRISQLLASYRRVDPGGIYYSFLGACAVQLDYNYTIHVGDKIELLSRRLNYYKNLE